MMQRLEWYIAKAIWRASTLTILALVFLLVFFNFIDELSDLKQGSYALGDAFLVALLSAPRYLFEVFPVAILLGGLLGLGGLASHSELIAMRAAGFSIKHIVIAVIKAGVALLLLAVVFGEWVAPASEQYAQQLRTEKQTGQVTFKSRYGFWARDDNTYINIRKIVSGTRLQELYIYQFDERQRLVLSSYVASADYQDGHWRMNEVVQTRFVAGGTQRQELATVRWGSLLKPSLLDVLVVRPTMLPVWDLDRYIRFMDENGQSATDYRVAFWLKVATPIAALVMLLLAVPFTLGSQRIGAGQRMFVGAVVGAMFFLVTRAASYIAVVYEFSPPLATFLPVALCLAGSLWLLRRVR